MIKLNKGIIIFSVLMVLFGSALLEARTKNSSGTGDKNAKDEIQRTVTSVFDLQKNTVSNIQFYTTNYGIFGLNVAANVGGGIWPRGSLNQYIFGGGIWFGAVKNRPNDTTTKKYVEVTYNPNNGRSWMVPGRMSPNPDDHTKDLLDESDINHYRTYFSTDYRAGDGADMNGGTYNWPIWDDWSVFDTLKHNRYFGHYIDDNNLRTKSTFPKGPAFISGEDIFATFKDTDLRNFDGGRELRSAEGYPLRIQFEQSIYSWGFGQYKDFIFLRYDLINYSKDVLKYCWMAPVMDVDIARIPNTQAGASNDRVRYYDEDPSLNLAFQWTNGDQGEAGKGFGYLGFSFLESPAVDADGFVRKDKRFYSNSEQLGLKTFRNWTIDIDPVGDDERYDFISAEKRDGDNGPGDKRFCMATGPFNIRPNDTVRVIVGVILAAPSVTNYVADGSTADVAGLVEKTKFAQTVYDNNFRAPAPPERSGFKHWEGLNNGIKLQWDNTSELSKDDYEGGLGFLGYRLYRARRTNLDTFNVDNISGSLDYPMGQGPFGWKQIAQWEVPTMFQKSVRLASPDLNNTNYPNIDSLRIAGFVWQSPTVVDSFSVRIMRLGRGVFLYGPESSVRNMTGGVYIPIITQIDSIYDIDKPWGSYFYSKVKQADFPIYLNPISNYEFDPNAQASIHRLLKEDMIGKVTLNRAYLSYNPLIWKKQTVPFASPSDTSILADRSGDTINLKGNYRWININGTNYLVYDRMIPQNLNNVFTDSLNVHQALDSIYSYIKRGYAKVEFPSVGSSDQVRNVISDYMYKITNGRTYIDIGDDNHTGTVQYNDDPTKTSKLLNNIDYYYRLISYDEGDYNQPTPKKQNSASPGLPNLVTVYPRAAQAGNLCNFQITYVDSARIGGLYNFQFFSTDNDKVAQLFSGHELELEFNPSMLYLANFNLPARTTPTTVGLYLSNMTIRDLTTNQILFDSTTFFEETPCRYSGWGGVEQLFTENAATFYASDSLIADSTIPGSPKYIDLGLPNSTSVINRAGKITTGDFSTAGYCYAMDLKPPAYGTIGFSFNFNIQQHGGIVRPDSSTLNYTYQGETLNHTPINFKDGMQLTTRVGTNSNLYYENGTFNNGPAKYKVTFMPGGTEQMDLQWGSGASLTHKTFTVPYLKMKVENVNTYNMLDENGNTIHVRYPLEIQHQVLDTLIASSKSEPSLLKLGTQWKTAIDKYNLTAFGWIDQRGITGLKLKPHQASVNGVTIASSMPLGQQGRYYMSCKSDDGQNQLDFVNQFLASGANFVFDYANTGQRGFTPRGEWLAIPDSLYTYGQDFKDGDVVYLTVTGGPAGLPYPGAKVRCKVSSADVPNNQLTDQMMDQIKVVPNPYYITHQGQKSPYDAKIYFTKLPKQCTINIYTINGELIRSINHDETSADGQEKHSVELWDLLSFNKERVQSQTMVAVIKSPNGAQAVKNFTVVVGGFRLIQQ